MKLKLLDQNKINYIITKTKSRTMSFSFLKDGSVSVKIPYFYNETLADLVCEKYIDKIIKNVNLKKETLATYETGEVFLLMGKVYKIMVVVSKYPKVILMDDILYLYTKKDEFKEKEKIINNFLIESAETLFNEELYKVFNLMKAELKEYPKLEIKKFKSVWGLCRYKKNTIALNIDLLHTDLVCLDYVICHELCHFRYPNHQQEFHEMVNRYVDEKDAKARLKNYRFKR